MLRTDVDLIYSKHLVLNLQRWGSYFLKVTHYLLLLPITKSNSLQLLLPQCVGGSKRPAGC